MQQTNDFIVLNIREYLKSDDGRLGEDKLLQLLSEFSCPLNTDVELFLKHQAIEFAKKHQAGGMVAFVEAENNAKLLSFYESYGFKQFDTRQTASKETGPHELVQLLRLF